MTYCLTSCPYRLGKVSHFRKKSKSSETTLKSFEKITLAKTVKNNVTQHRIILQPLNSFC